MVAARDDDGATGGFLPNAGEKRVVELLCRSARNRGIKDVARDEECIALLGFKGREEPVEKLRENGVAPFS